MDRSAALIARPVPAAIGAALLASPVLLVMTRSVTAAADPVPVDFGLFGPAGARLLTGQWAAVFDDPLVQAGPFELLPWGLLQVSGVSGQSGWVVALTICAVVTAFLTALVLRPVLAPDLRSSVLAAVGTLLLAVFGPLAGSWTIGHPSEVLVPLVWVVAARFAIRDRPVLAAALVAASTGFEVWGVLGAPVVLLAARPRLVRAAAAGGAVLAVLWVPFIVLGPFRMFAFSWDVNQSSVLHLLIPAATSAPWSWRLVQAVVAVGAGCAAASLLRGRRAAWGPWVVVVAVVSGRLVLDPVLADYYGYPAMVGAAGALVLALRGRDWFPATVAAFCLVVAWINTAPVLSFTVLVAIALAGALALRYLQASAPTGRAAPVGSLDTTR